MKLARKVVMLSVVAAMFASAQTSDENAATGVLAPVAMTFETNPPGLTVIVDGTVHASPYSTDWEAGTEHTISTTGTQLSGNDTRFVFVSWSDGGALTHTVTAPRRSWTYTAHFSTQYLLIMSANPANGGTVTPSTGWHNSGQGVAINASAASGYNFSRWVGTGTGSYNGTMRSTTITVGGPITQTATFTPATEPILTVTPADRAISSKPGSTTFSVRNTGAGTMNWTAVSNESWASITGGASGADSGTITVSYTANPSSAESRSATITVTATGATGSPKSVTVSQSPGTVLNLIRDTTSVSDDFGGDVLNADLWTVVDPMGDAAVTVANNHLTLAIPGGVAHEPWTGGNTAPRVLQQVVPAMNVNAWTVKFNTVPVGSASSIPMEGLLFVQDSLNFVRTDIFSDGASVYAFAAQFVNGLSDPRVLYNHAIPVTGPPVWLHATRAGNLWRVYCSTDGVTAFLLGSFEHEITLTRVGVFAGSAGTSPQPFTSVVDYFQGALPAKPYLSLPDSGVVGLSAPMMFTWHAATGATGYRLQIAKSPLFLTNIMDTMVTEPSAIISALGPDPAEFWWRVAGKNDAGWGEFSDPRMFSTFPASVASSDLIPDRFGLDQNFPNPFNPTTVVGSQLPGASHVKLAVYDILGREVAVLADERRGAGRYRDVFAGENRPSGVYFYRLVAGSFVQTRAMLLLR